MSDGPTIYAAVMDNRLADALAPVEQLVAWFVPMQIQEDARHRLNEMLRQAYVRGVIDGFAQGVSAATISENKEAQHIDRP